MERDLVTREGVDFMAIKAGALHGVGAARMARGLARNAAGTLQAMRAVGRFRPDVVLLTGGFVGVPVTLAAFAHRVPSLVYLPDIEPGAAVKLMAVFASAVAATADDSARYFAPGKTVVTGYPVRDVFAAADRASARASFGLPADEQVVLVFGGSKGARSINRAALAGLGELLGQARVIHVSGAADWDEVRAARDSLSAEARARYLAFPYLHEEMAAAMAAADLAVCRAGASALGELPYVGLPAVLVPYPYAWRYQKVNAQYLMDRGAAVLLRDEQLGDPVRGLVQTVGTLLRDPIRLERMRAAALSLSRRDGAERIARVLVDLAAGKPASVDGGAP